MISNPLPLAELKELLDQKHVQYETPEFIETDPIQIPHRFAEPHNIEIAAFFTSIIAWGQRSQIIKNADRLMQRMDYAPYDFILHATEHEISRLNYPVHRTFQGVDCMSFVHSLRHLYHTYGGLQAVFKDAFQQTASVSDSIIHFRKLFFEIDHPARTQKHIADIQKKSSAKRLNLFLMWMVRSNARGVHFGLWDFIPTSALYIPLDVHVGNCARGLGLLTRSQNDWTSVDLLTQELRALDVLDPVKYDFALFGLSIFEGKKGSKS